MEDSHGRLRLATDVTELNIEGSLPQDLADKLPGCALVLDLDHTHPAVGPFHLTKEALKDFFRTAWQRSKAAGTMFRKHLGSTVGE